MLALTRCLGKHVRGAFVYPPKPKPLCQLDLDPPVFLGVTRWRDRRPAHLDLPIAVGMLFAYAEPLRISMWMKNTLIPLDMLFFDALNVDNLGAPLLVGLLRHIEVLQRHCRKGMVR